MLQRQLAAAKRDQQMALQRQERLTARLLYLELEDQMPNYDVTLKIGEPLTIAAIREIVPTIEQMPARCQAMFDHIARWMTTRQLPFGPAMTTYFNEGYSRENIDTECAFVIPNAAALPTLTPDSPIVIRQVEPVPQVASTIVADDFYLKPDGLTPAYQHLAQWIEAHGYQIVGPARELFYGSAQRGYLTA
jgi:effector-binding domain-containing protein